MAWYDRFLRNMFPHLPAGHERVEAPTVGDARSQVNGRRAHNVPSSRILDGDPDAHGQAQVSCFTQRRDPTEPGQFQPSHVQCALFNGVEQRRETRQALIEDHRLPGHLLHGTAFASGRARLLEEDVKLGEVPSDPDRVVPGPLAVGIDNNAADPP